MDKEHGTPPVQLREQWLEQRIGERLAEHGGCDRNPDHTEFVQAAREFGERGPDVRQRGSDKRPEPVRILTHEVSIQVIGEPCRFDGAGLPLEVRQLRRDREDLQINAGFVHHLEARFQVTRFFPREPVARAAGRMTSKAFQNVEVFRGEVVSVYVDAHLRLLLTSRAISPFEAPCSFAGQTPSFVQTSTVL